MKNDERRLKSNLSMWAVCLLLTCTLNFAYAHPWPGSGTSGDPFLISDANGMQAIGADANYWSSCFKLVNDIDMSQFTGTQYKIIGNSSIPFSGIFDGNSHTIYNFTYESDGVSYIGLFGYKNGSEIRNLNLTDVNIIAGTGSYVGPIAGYTSAETRNCSVRNATLSGNDYIGGFVGANSSNIYDSSVTEINITGRDYLGGLAGDGYRVYNSSVRGYINGTQSQFVGGIYGRMNQHFYPNIGIISNCFADCNISNPGSPQYFVFVGGLVGRQYWGNRIERSFSMGNIRGDGIYFGGLVGYNTHVNDGYTARIEDSYSSTNVYMGEYIGGLIGYCDGGIYRCLSTGEVNSIFPETGGFVGSSSNSSYYQDCFWDQNVNPGLFGVGSGKSSSEVVGKTTAQLKTKSTFTGASWDFNNVWAICENTNYPKLIWQIPSADLACPDGVTFVDYSVLSKAWMSDPNLPNWDPNSDISEPNDLVINNFDVSVFANQWLTGLRN